MAHQVSYWQVNGKSDEEIKHIRIKSLAEVDKLIESRPAFTDVITLERTDHQSNNYRILWQAPGYIDLNDRA